MRYLSVLLLSILFIGCSTKSVKLQEKKSEIYDLAHLPQNVSAYTKNIQNSVTLFDIQKEYEQNYFSMWNIEKPQEKLSALTWAFSTYKVGESYGENLQPLKQSFFDKMYKMANIDDFATLNKRAITLKQSNLRAFPTQRPLLKDPALAGEGFPFDYLQNSSIQANKPIFISHYSKNKEWVFVFSSFTSGWLKATDIAFMPKRYTDLWQKAQQVFITKDNIPIYSENGDFLFNSKVGMMLALVGEDAENYTVLTVSSYKNSKPLFLKSKISKEIAHKGIYALNKNNIEKIITSIFNTNYGWGGMYGQRDCSSTLRDLYAPFGIWLPRNSSKQAKIGEVISLKNLSDKEKIKLIKEKATPFQTLLYKPGHIVLYVGIYNNKIIILHNTWGIKTKKDGVEGRIIIGKTIFSTLMLGEKQKYYDKNSSILSHLESMNILTHL